MSGVRGRPTIRRLLKATAAIGGARAVEIAVALARQKVLAILLGPAGVGVLAWIRNVCDLFITSPLLGLDGGAVRFISVHARDNDREAIRRVVSTTLWAALVNTPLVVVAYLWLAPAHIGRALENGHDYLPYLRVGLLSVPFASCSAVFGAFLIGFKEVRRASALIVISSVMTLLIGVPLIVLYRLWGAVIGLVVLQIVNVCLYGYNFSRVFPISLRRPSLATARRMSGVAAAQWIGGTLSLFALLTVRSHLSVAYSNDVVGLYQSIFALCSSYLGPLSHTLIFYSFPRMSELRDNREIVDEINGTLRVVLLLATPAMVLMAIAVKPILFLLYSSKFVAAAPLLPFQMVGEWLRLPMRSMGVALIGQERLKAYMLFDWMFYAVLLAFTLGGGAFFEIANEGRLMTVAPCVGYAAAALVVASGYYVTCRRAFGFRLGSGNVRLLGASFVVLIVSLFVTAPGPWGAAAVAGKVALLGVWAWFVVRPEEWTKAWELLSRRLARLRGGVEKND